MADSPPLKPQSFEILAVRELRKAGFVVGNARISRRSELAEPEQGSGGAGGAFVLELTVPLTEPNTTWTRRALVVCRRQLGYVARDVIDAALARLGEASADVVIIFSTAPFTPDAQAAAHEGGVALLQIVDGRSAFDASGWGGGNETADHYPAWLPAHMAQIVDRDAAGQPRLRLLEAGRPDMILDVLGSGTHG